MNFQEWAELMKSEGWTPMLITDEHGQSMGWYHKTAIVNHAHISINAAEADEYQRQGQTPPPF